MVDEVEQAIVCPVDVLEHQHERSLVGEGLEIPAPGSERLVPPILGRGTRGLETREGPEVRGDPGAS